MAVRSRGAGGEASINMTDLKLDGRHPPTPPPSLPFLSPGLPGRGLSFGRPARFEKPVLFFGGKEGATPSRRRIIRPPGNSRWPYGE